MYKLMYSSQITLDFSFIYDERAAQVPEEGSHGVLFLYGNLDILAYCFVVR